MEAEILEEEKKIDIVLYCMVNAACAIQYSLRAESLRLDHVVPEGQRNPGVHRLERPFHHQTERGVRRQKLKAGVIAEVVQLRAGKKQVREWAGHKGNGGGGDGVSTRQRMRNNTKNGVTTDDTNMYCSM